MAEDIDDVCFGVKTGKAQSEHDFRSSPQQQT
jgi:hypothetical protein